MFSLKKKHIGWAIGTLLILIPVIINIFNGIKRTKDLKDSVVIFGKVESVEHTRGATYVNLQYLYKGQLIHNSFQTNDREVLDSLKIETKVRLKVSKKYPTQYIEYIGVYNQ